MFEFNHFANREDERNDGCASDVSLQRYERERSFWSKTDERGGGLRGAVQPVTARANQPLCASTGRVLVSSCSASKEICHASSRLAFSKGASLALASAAARSASCARRLTAASDAAERSPTSALSAASSARRRSTSSALAVSRATLDDGADAGDARRSRDRIEGEENVLSVARRRVSQR